MFARLRFSVALAGLLALFCATAPVLGASSTNTVALNFDRMVARFWNADGHRGLVLLDQVDADAGTGRLTWALRGLVPGANYRIVLSEAACNAPLMPANVIFSAVLSAGTYGRGTFGAFVGTANGGVWHTANSVRVVRRGGRVWQCVRAMNFMATDTAADADAAYARFGGSQGPRGLVFARQGEGGTAVSVALGRLHPGDDYAVRGSTAACGSPGTTLFGAMFNNVGPSVFRSTRFDDTDIVHVLMSIRVRNLTTGVAVCRNVVMLDAPTAAPAR